MGNWAATEFGVSILPARAYLFAGVSQPAKVDAIIHHLGTVQVHRQDVYERFLVTHGDRQTAVMFQLYGAPVMCDLATVLHTGQVQEVIFFGYAGALAEGLRIGECVVPVEVQALDGVTAKLGGGPYATPDPDLVETITSALDHQHLPFRRGKTVSVPATFWHGDETQIDPDALAVELELAAWCHCARTMGIKTAGILTISDTSEMGLLDERPPCDPAMITAFQAVLDYWER